MDREQILAGIKNGLIVSCQADAGEPLDSPATMAALARAAVAGGAVGIRAERPANLRAVRAAVEVPVIGLFKQKYPDSEVYITPTANEVMAVLNTGVPIIALDATDRPRPGRETLGQLIQLIRNHSTALIMADIATVAEGLAAAQLGVDLVGTTLSGYTEATKAQALTGRPDFRLIMELSQQLEGKVPVIAEGRIWTPEDAIGAFRCGAHSVVVGTAITRPTVITWQISHAIDHYHQRQAAQAIGIDLGGTKTAIGMVAGDGRVLHKRVITTPWQRGTAAVVASLVSVLRELGDQHVAAIGIAASGRVDYQKGVIGDGIPLASDYLGFPLAAAIGEATHKMVTIENDANAAAMAEYYRLPFPGPACLVALTIGTGIGGGVVINGQLLRGHGNAGEIGHICVVKNGRSCACGRRGCLEQYVSRKLLQIEIEHLIAAGKIDLPEGRKIIDTETIIQMIQAQQPAVVSIFQQQLDYLACGIETVVNTIDPDLVILGGEIARLGATLSQGVQCRLARPLTILTSTLGNDAALIGAARLALEKRFI